MHKPSILSALKLFCLLNLVIFLPAFHASELEAQTTEKVSVQFHWQEQFEFSGFYIAREKGFYTDAGLDVSFLPFIIGSTNVVDNVLSGKAQYGVNYTSIIQDYHEQKPVVALAALLQDSPLVLMTLDNPDISRPSDLKNKEIMLGGDALNAAPIMALLFSDGLIRSEIKKLEHSHNIDDLINGNTAAMSAFISNEPYQMKQKGVAYKIFDPRENGLSFYENLLFTSRDEITNNPERALKFLRATLRGYQYAYNHVMESAQIIHDKYNEQGKSLDSLIYEGNELRKRAYREGVKLGDINLAKLARIEDAYRLMGVSLSSKPINDFVWKAVMENDQLKNILTSDEKLFIDKTEIHAATTTNWYPFAYVDEKSETPSGIGHDFWQLIVNQAGLTSYTSQFNSFAKELEAIKNHQKDIIYSAGITEDRLKYALFSKPYASFPISIATSKDEHFIQSVEQLSDKRIAVGRNFTAHKMMEAAYPDLEYIPVPNVHEGLQLVSHGKAYAFVDILPALSHSINKYGFTNLKISGNTGLIFDMRLMIRNDYPELVSIVNKAIDLMPSITRQEILNRYVNIQYQDTFNIWQYWPQLAIVTLCVLFVIAWQHHSKKTAQLANIAKSEFLASMSHEIRTPMTSVLGFSDLLLDEELPEKSREKVQHIKESTHSLLHLLNDILDMSKLEAGRMEVEKIDFNIQTLVTELVEQIKLSHLGEKPIKVTALFDHDFPEFINADQKKLRQILVNLLGNAAKFTAEGTINVQCSLHTKDNIHYLKISVDDTGIGIEPDISKKLFTPFTQADASISRKFEGTGLGLAICKRLIELMDGKIGVVSQPAQGSKFWIEIPYLAAVKTSRFSENQKTSAFKAVRELNILLAEDVKVNQIIIKKILTTYGHNVDIAENGLEAVAKHKENSYDLILMDIRMPEMNGAEATKTIRTMSGEKAKIPVIAVTADVVQENIEDYLSFGIDDFVHKPIDKTVLLQTINKVLKQEIHITATEV